MLFIQIVNDNSFGSPNHRNFLHDSEFSFIPKSS